MSEGGVIQAALAAAGIGSPVRAARDLSGGCMHRVRAIDLEDGRRLVVKSTSAAKAALFEEEAQSLRALAASGTVVVPEPLAVGVFGEDAVLVMTAVRPAPPTDGGWRTLGAALASLHAADAGARYGFEADNHLGLTAQPNGWMDDWVVFNAERRLGWQVELARRAGVLAAPDLRRLDRVIERLERFIPRSPKPALLHGDLWSGNALPTVDAGGRATVAVIDPACSIGDGWADVAMMKLFGGFPDACLAAYAAAVRDHDHIDERIAVYQLYHLLNHVNLFGAGYVGQAIGVVQFLER